MKHISVLLQEVLASFQDVKIESFIDGTLGAAGHALALLGSHEEIKNFYGLDKDRLALEIGTEVLSPFKDKVKLIHTGFEEMGTLFPQDSIDGILLDLGVSSMQLDTDERGFSFMKEGPLDMRMDSSQGRDAAFIVNSYREDELGQIFREYGEERFWRKAAKAICEARKKRKITTTTELAEVLMKVLSPHGGRGKIHPATRIFQALRIEVNGELEVLQKGLKAAFSLLRSGGRLSVISFHSLEDRIVKHFFKACSLYGKILTKKPITATLEEMKKNPRSRSAKLRVLEKL